MFRNWFIVLVVLLVEKADAASSCLKGQKCTEREVGPPGPRGPSGPCPTRSLEGNMTVTDGSRCGVSKLISTYGDPGVNIGASWAKTTVFGPQIFLPTLDGPTENATTDLLVVDDSTGQVYKTPLSSSTTCECFAPVPVFWNDTSQVTDLMIGPSNEGTSIRLPGIDMQTVGPGIYPDCQSKPKPKPFPDSSTPNCCNNPPRLDPLGNLVQPAYSYCIPPDRATWPRQCIINGNIPPVGALLQECCPGWHCDKRIGACPEKGDYGKVCIRDGETASLQVVSTGTIAIVPEQQDNPDACATVEMRILVDNATCDPPRNYTVCGGNDTSMATTDFDLSMTCNVALEQNASAPIQLFNITVVAIYQGVPEGASEDTQPANVTIGDGTQADADAGVLSVQATYDFNTQNFTAGTLPCRCQGLSAVFVDSEDQSFSAFTRQLQFAAFKNSTIAPWSTLLYDSTAGFNTVTGLWTAAQSGKYSISIQGTFGCQHSFEEFQGILVEIVGPSSLPIVPWEPTSFSSLNVTILNFSVMGHTELPLNAGDTLYARLNNGSPLNVTLKQFNFAIHLF
jgi:hypothetical protein